jgi:small subunit ribosomal protein S20
MRISAEENIRNRAIRSRMKKHIKDLEVIKVKAEAESKIKQVVSIIDKAVRDGIIHKNTAARHKSKLMLKINSFTG